MFLGKLQHEALDLLNKNEQTIIENIKEKTSKEKIKNLYQDLLRNIALELFRKNETSVKIFNVNFSEFFSRLMEQAEQEIELRAKACIETLEKGFLAGELWKNLFPRYLSEYSLISQKLGLKGRVDRIEFSQEILPYELKTRQEIFEADKIQLTAYSLLIEEHFNQEIKKGIIETKNTREEIEITEEMRNKVLEIIKKIQELIEKAPEITENFKKCQNCAFNRQCLEV